MSVGSRVAVAVADVVKVGLVVPVGVVKATWRISAPLVGEKMGIKASGGIRTWEQAVRYLEQGVTRLGIGATETVLDGGTAEEFY